MAVNHASETTLQVRILLLEQTRQCARSSMDKSRRLLSVRLRVQLLPGAQKGNMQCFACGGPYHPATGHLFREFMVAYCGRCYRHFIEWMKQHMRRRWGGLDFYAEAAKRPRSSSGQERDAPTVEAAGPNPAEDTNVIKALSNTG